MQTLTTPILPSTNVLVKSPGESIISATLNSMRHHSNHHKFSIIGNRERVWRLTRYYGVSSDYRILTKGLFVKRFDQVRDFLQYVLGLPTAEREVILRLLGYWSHYGVCYPTVARLCEEPGCSKATAWRVIGKLKGYGMMHTVPRYLTPYRRQISDIFILHGLLLLLARYLAEHGVHFWEKWLAPVLSLSGRDFWSGFWQLADRERPP